MKAVEIWTTLLLPMCVSPRRPTFSLQHHAQENGLESKTIKNEKETIKLL